MSKSEWDQIEAEVERMIALSSEPFDAGTIANVRDLLAVCRTEVVLPPTVARGYWSTIRFLWSGFELEVFEDRLEVYHFHGEQMDIWYEEHKPGEPFSRKFFDEMKRSVTQG